VRACKSTRSALRERSKNGHAVVSFVKVGVLEVVLLRTLPLPRPFIALTPPLDLPLRLLRLLNAELDRHRKLDLLPRRASRDQPLELFRLSLVGPLLAL
jgi:hypothetical protein